MAQMAWTFDAPTGVYKNHALSAKIYEAAIEEMVFMDHVLPLNEMGRKRGENITLTRVAQLSEPTSAKLSETERIPEDSFSITTTSITCLLYTSPSPRDS